MRFPLAALALVLLAQRADAEPAHHLQLGVRVGYQWTGLGKEYQLADGSGRYAEGSVGWRFRPRRSEVGVSVALYGAYARYDSVYRVFGSYRSPVIWTKELGPRVSVHFHGLFAGVGAARIRMREKDSGPIIATFYPYPYSYDTTRPGNLVSLHAGFSSPRVTELGGIAFQVLVVVCRGWQDEAYDDDTIESTRIAVGIEY